MWKIDCEMCGSETLKEVIGHVYVYIYTQHVFLYTVYIYIYIMWIYINIHKFKILGLPAAGCFLAWVQAEVVKEPPSRRAQMRKKEAPTRPQWNAFAAVEGWDGCPSALCWWSKLQHWTVGIRLGFSIGFGLTRKTCGQKKILTSSLHSNWLKHQVHFQTEPRYLKLVPCCTSQEAAVVVYGAKKGDKTLAMSAKHTSVPSLADFRLISVRKGARAGRNTDRVSLVV